jgi:hypothetical protein
MRVAQIDLITKAIPLSPGDERLVLESRFAPFPGSAQTAAFAMPMANGVFVPVFSVVTIDAGRVASAGAERKVAFRTTTGVDFLGRIAVSRRCPLLTLSQQPPVQRAGCALHGNLNLGAIDPTFGEFRRTIARANFEAFGRLDAAGR